MTEQDVLFEDNHIIIVNKRAGQIVQIDESRDQPLDEIVKAFLKKKHKKEGNVFLGVIHRLDRPVSGCIMFAKTSKALARLNKMFQEKKIQKTYWALCLKQPVQDSGKVSSYLVKDRSKNKTKSFPKQVRDGKFSELEYEKIKSIRGEALIEVNPLTGRPHQIRVQLASIGCIIKGDLKYGASIPNADKSICLHSRKVQLIHPVSQESICVTAPILQKALWGL
jgi:23S rRNA pseudouridine1911/1915/1917 synthase